jgi:hypothetical protein
VCDSVHCTTRRVERLGDKCIIDYYLLVLWELVLRLLARARVICTRAMEPAGLQVSTSFCLTLALQLLAQASKQRDRNPMLLFPSHYLPPRVGISIHPVAIQCLAYRGQDVKYLSDGKCRARRPRGKTGRIWTYISFLCFALPFA